MRHQQPAKSALVVFTALLASAAASAQVVITDESSGMTLTLADTWTLVNDAKVAMAINEEGCVMGLATVPAVESEAVLKELDAFLGDLIDTPMVTESSMQGDAFAASGTGRLDGEPVRWEVAGAIEQGKFGLIFTAATQSATTCTTEMQKLLKGR